MNATKFIEEHLEPRKVLEFYNFKGIHETQDSIRACCKIHGGDNDSGFVWKKDNNLWFCYTGDCHGGDVFNLIMKLDNCGFVEAVKKAGYILGLDINGMEIRYRAEAVEREQQRWLEEQRNKLKGTKPHEYQLANTKYLNTSDSFTRFEPEILEFYGAKFCTIYPTENGILRNKLVIPITSEGICVGVALRDTTGSFTPKWFYQPDGLKIGELLYNFDRAVENLSIQNEIILVEGIFDVWAYHRIGIDNVVAVFGSSLKDAQYKKLLITGASITLSFDNDKAGNKCKESTLKKFRGKSQIKAITLPDNKDPADCTKEELMECYMRRSTV